MNDPTNRVYLDEPIEGLELPSVRTSRGQRAGQSGSYIGAQFDDARFITLNGHIWSSDIAEAKQKRRDIQEALPLHPDSITVRIDDDDGRSYETVVQYVDFKMPINRAKFRHVFKINLEATDPTLYDMSAGSALTATIQKAIPGGIQFTSTSPQFDASFQFTQTQSISVVNNSSPNVAYPVITITGRITNPVLTNQATGDSFSLTGYAVTGSTDVTVIDMANHTVTLNNGNAFGYVPLTAEWWGLMPGDNTIDFTSGSGSDVTTAVMTWRPGYRGI
ncbi:hypothetical protein AB0280_17480 [Pseudarthrobacter sp902506025]|uniref:phage distal tail protein n=1 Tax=Pseudarthrobacter sp. 902506025 TaxID=3155291 RepID=UPI00344F0F00